MSKEIVGNLYRDSFWGAYLAYSVKGKKVNMIVLQNPCSDNIMYLGVPRRHLGTMEKIGPRDLTKEEAHTFAICEIKGIEQAVKDINQAVEDEISAIGKIRINSRVRRVVSAG
jgi:hypothetical protein